MNLKEAKLAKPIYHYFKDKGYKVYAEYSIYYRSVDFILCKNKTLIAIELKTSLTKKVIQQANSCKSSVDMVYIVVATNPKKESLDKCEQMGLGVISLKDNNLTELIKPSSEGYTNQRKKEEILKELKSLQESSNAGKPNLEGSGPAQSIKEEVLKLKNEGKSWKEIYEIVPNHYSSYKSLQSSMSLLEERERLKEQRKIERDKLKKTLKEYLILKSLWDNKKSFISNKRNWLSLEENFIFGTNSLKMLNTYKYYNSIIKYLIRRIEFYKNKDNIIKKEELLNKIKKLSYVKIEDCFDFDKVVYILLQERLIREAYLPVLKGKIIDKVFTSRWQLKKEYDESIEVYIPFKSSFG